MDRTHEQAEHLSETPDVKRELEQSTGVTTRAPEPVASVQKLWFTTYIILLLSFAAAYYFLELRFFNFADPYVALIERIVTGGMAIVLRWGSFERRVSILSTDWRTARPVII